MKISTLVDTFGEGRARFGLDSGALFTDVDELGKLAVNVLVDVVPVDSVKHGVHFWNLADDDPIAEQFDFFFLFVGVEGELRSILKSDWAHVVVIAVVDVAFFFIFQSGH